MRTLTENELNEVLHKHKLWLNGMEGGERADLCGADLRGADLSGADLRGTNLSGADLCGADLSEADLSGADLRRTDLREVDLRWTDLRGADLSEADLSGADLRWTDLRGADLSEADLSEADLRWTDLRGARNIPYIPLACPEEGSFIGFKKALLDGNYVNHVIVKLLIPEDAKRSSATTNKCRCSKAKVLDIQDIEGNSLECIARSNFNFAFKYKIGEIVEVKDFDENRFNECAPGIHFFINRQDAVNY